MKELCGHLLTSDKAKGKTCANKAGHNGQHRSAEGVKKRRIDANARRSTPEYQKQWREKNPDYVSPCEQNPDYVRPCRLRNPRYAADISRNRYANSLEERMRNSAKTWKQGGIVGMTFDLFDMFVIIQRDRCAICKRQFVISADRIGYQVDHDHAITDRFNVRGLLCGKCNRSLAPFDSGEYLPGSVGRGLRITAYLDHFKAIDALVQSGVPPIEAISYKQSDFVLAV
jgi:hypothetical protein